MKRNLRSGVPFIFILSLIAFSHTSAHLINTKLDEKMQVESSSLDLQSQTIASSFNEVMGMEECGSEDEECLKRRVVAEAHLDYIYTQQHTP